MNRSLLCLITVLTFFPLIETADLPIALAADVKQVMIAEWNFDNESQTASGGIESNLHQNISLAGANLAGYVLGFGSGSRAINSNRWNTSGESYWLIQFTTTGYESLTLSSRQYGSNTGPRDFKVQFSLNGTTWTDVPNAAITVGYNWASGYLYETALPEETNHQKLVYIRWLKTSDTSVRADSSLGTTGSNRIDDIVVYGLPRERQEVQEEIPDQVNGADESSEHEAEELHNQPAEDELASDHEKEQEEKAAPETDDHLSGKKEEQQDQVQPSEETEHDPVPEIIQAGPDSDGQEPQPDLNPPMRENHDSVAEEPDVDDQRTELDSNSPAVGELVSDREETQPLPESREHINEPDSYAPAEENPGAGREETLPLPQSEERMNEPDSYAPAEEDPGAGREEAQPLPKSEKHKREHDSFSPVTEEHASDCEKTQPLPQSEEHKREHDSFSPVTEEYVSDREKTQPLPQSEEHKREHDSFSPVTEEYVSDREETQPLPQSEEHMSEPNSNSPAEGDPWADREETPSDLGRNGFDTAPSPLEEETVSPAPKNKDAHFSADKKSTARNHEKQIAEMNLPAHGGTFREKTDRILSNTAAERSSRASHSVNASVAMNPLGINRQAEEKPMTEHTPAKADSTSDLNPEKDNSVQKHRTVNHDFISMKTLFLFGTICLLLGAAILLVIRNRRSTKAS
ncbi:hypothetical protein VSK92_08115 [Bacillus swezeyi]